MSDDNDIYNSEEYKARKERAERSLHALVFQHNGSNREAIDTAAESIAYWQMRTVLAEGFLFEEGYLGFRNKSNREM